MLDADPTGLAEEWPGTTTRVPVLVVWGRPLGPEPSPPAGDEGTGVTSAVLVEMGLVRVTVVGVAAQWVQTVTVVVQPSGIDGVVVANPEAGLVTLAVASGQTVVVMVVVIVVKPVGQISVYEVTMIVVVMSGSVDEGAGVTEGEALMTEVMVGYPVPVGPEEPAGWVVPVALTSVELLVADAEPETDGDSDTTTELEGATWAEDAELEIGTRDGLDTGDWVTGEWLGL